MKFTKITVGFESPARGMNDCDECLHYLGGRCEIVEGIVQAHDWCRKFKLDPAIKEHEVSMTERHVEHMGHVEHHDDRQYEGRSQKSPTKIIKEQSNVQEDQRKTADARSNYPGEGIKEHGLHVTSRTNGKSVEIGFGPQGNGLVPANPFASLAQEGYLHAHPEKLGKTALAEWDSATRGKKLPKRVKKGK